MAESTIFYRSFYDAIEKLPSDEDKLKAFEMIAAYGLGEDVEESGTLADIVFTMAKPQIDANNERRANGCKGGRTKKEKPMVPESAEKEKPMVPENAENKKPNVNVNEKVKVKEKVNANDDGKESKEKSAAVAADALRPSNTDYQAIVDAYNQTCVSFPSVKFLSDSRKKAIHARLNTYSLGDFQTMFEKAEKSDFLKGANDRNWSANFDWMIKDANFAKILDGNYDNGSARSSPRGHPKSRKEELEEMYRMTEEWANS